MNMNKTDFKSLIKECFAEILNESQSNEVINPLIDKSKPWVFVSFEDNKGPHTFYSGINKMSGDRMTGFDNNPPSINDDMSYVNKVIQNISNKAKNVKIDGSIKPKVVGSIKENHYSSDTGPGTTQEFYSLLKHLQDGPIDVDFNPNKKEPQLYKGADLTKIWDTLRMKSGEKSFDGDINYFASYANYLDKEKENRNKQIKENENPPVQTAPESELKRTQSDFENGKIVRGLTSQPVKVQVKLELKAKDGTVALKPSQTIDVYFGKKDTHVYIFSEGKWWSLNITGAHKYLTRFKQMPSIQTLNKMSDSGIASTPIGTRVEPDGHGPNGEPSWMLVAGVI